MKTVEINHKEGLVFIVKDEFFEKIPYEKALEETAFNLFQQHQIHNYLHCETGPALRDVVEPSENYFINGEPIFGEAVDRIKHASSFNKELDTLLKDGTQNASQK